MKWKILEIIQEDLKMKAMKLIGVLALVMGAATAQASIVMPDLRVKEQVGNFNPQPEPPGKSIILQ
ncbi:hypothetical protein D0C16_13935 [Cellvibrio sp. KY-GH-1]|nr:hypothetical protein D0C16_13935 [Cellvibrio sp. KY-GH-1]